MDMVGASQQLTETGRRLKQYGTNLDSVLKFIRDPRNAEKVKIFLQSGGLLDGETIYESPSKIKYVGHPEGALVETGDEDGCVMLCMGEESNECLLELNNLSKRGIGDDAIYFPHPEGIVVQDAKRLILEEKILGEMLSEKEFSWVDNSNIIVNPSGTIFFSNWQENANIPVGVFLYKDGKWHPVARPKYADNMPEKFELGIWWADFLPSGKEVKYLHDTRSQDHGYFFCDEEMIAVAPPGLALKTEFKFGISSRGLVTAFSPYVFFNGKKVYDSEWSELRVCDEGFVVQHGDSLRLNGNLPIYTGEFVDWDVCAGGIIIQKQTNAGFQLQKIPYDCTVWDLLTPIEMERLVGAVSHRNIGKLLDLI